MSSQVKMSKDYKRFQFSFENREINLSKHSRLKKSMEEHGFLPSFPILVKSHGERFEIIDGQHRFTFAQQLNLPVYYLEATEEDLDIAGINNTSVKWSVDDYAHKYAKTNEDYQFLIEFSQKYKISINRSASMLFGHASAGYVSEEFKDGRFKVRDQAYAFKIGEIYSEIGSLCKETQNSRFTDALSAVCRVEEFDHERFIRTAKRCRELLGSYSTRDGYLEMIEKIYNHGSKFPIPLKLMAINVMRKRNAKRRWEKED